MKKAYYPILFLLLALCSACNDWLDVNPRSQIKGEELYKSEDGFKKALEIPEVKEKIEYYGFTVDYQDAEGFRQVWLDTVEQYKTVIAELGDRLTE